MLDPNDVQIIDDSNRALNRQTENMGDPRNRIQLDHGGDEELDPNNYGDEIIQREDSSNFQVDQNGDDDDTGLGQLHDQLQQLEGNQQQIIDDQNLNLDPNSDSKN